MVLVDALYYLKYLPFPSIRRVVQPDHSHNKKQARQLNYLSKKEKEKERKLTINNNRLSKNGEPQHFPTTSLHKDSSTTTYVGMELKTLASRLSAWMSAPLAKVKATCQGHGLYVVRMRGRVPNLIPCTG